MIPYAQQGCAVDPQITSPKRPLVHAQNEGMHQLLHSPEHAEGESTPPGIPESSRHLPAKQFPKIELGRKHRE